MHLKRKSGCYQAYFGWWMSVVAHPSWQVDGFIAMPPHTSTVKIEYSWPADVIYHHTWSCIIWLLCILFRLQGWAITAILIHFFYPFGDIVYLGLGDIASHFYFMYSYFQYLIQYISMYAFLLKWEKLCNQQLLFQADSIWRTKFESKNLLKIIQAFFSLELYSRTIFISF